VEFISLEWNAVIKFLVKFQEELVLLWSEIMIIPVILKCHQAGMIS